MADQLTPEQLMRLQAMAGLQAGATGQRPAMPGQAAPGPDQRMTQDDENRMRATQLMQLANSPTKGQVQPNAADLAAQDANMQSQMDELGEGTEVPDPQQARFQMLKKRMGQ